MKTCAVVVGSAVLLAGLIIGCSEKQKEAARLEARMKLGDTAVVAQKESALNSDNSEVIDTAVAQISAEITAQAVESPPHSGVWAEPGDTLQAGQAVVAEADSGGIVRTLPAPAESTEQVLDAGAIPDEEQIKKSPAPARVATDLSAQPEGSGYVVQVSSTPDQAEANALAAKYNRNGYHAFVTEVFVEGTTYFRVRIGRYDSISSAENALTELNQKFGVSGFVAQVK